MEQLYIFHTAVMYINRAVIYVTAPVLASADAEGVFGATLVNSVWQLRAEDEPVDLWYTVDVRYSAEDLPVDLVGDLRPIPHGGQLRNKSSIRVSRR